MHIRAAERSDLGGIRALLQASFPADLSGLMTYMQPGIIHYLGAFLDHPELSADRNFLVATQPDSTLVAFGEFMCPSQRSGFVNYVCVDASARGQGVAGAMIRHFVRSRGRDASNTVRGNETALDDVQLDVFEDNGSALKLYARLGFVPLRRSGWWTRPLAELVLARPVAPLVIRNLPHALAAFKSLGSCEFAAQFGDQPVRLGRIGEETLRCFDAQTFNDEALLATVKELFPSLQRAFLVAPLGEGPGSQLPMKVAVRMQAPAQSLRESGGAEP